MVGLSQILKKRQGQQGDDRRACCIPRHESKTADLPRQQLTFDYQSDVKENSGVWIIQSPGRRHGTDVAETKYRGRQFEACHLWNSWKGRLNLWSEIYGKSHHNRCPRSLSWSIWDWKQRSELRDAFMWESMERQMAMHVSLPFWRY